MGFEEFRDVNELTSEEIVGQEIDELMYRKAVIDSKRREKEQQEATQQVKESKEEHPKKDETKEEQSKKEQVKPVRSKKSKDMDANLVACDQDHEMGAILTKFKKPNTQDNRNKVRLLCKDFKSKEEFKPHNRDNFYDYLEKSAVFKKIGAPIKKRTTKKKQTPKTIIVDEEDATSKWLTIIVSAIAILAVIVGAYFIFNPTNSTPIDKVAAVVNGVPIYNSDIDARFEIIRTSENPYVTRENVLEQAIDQQLLVQEAEEQNMTTSDKEVTNTLTKSLERGGMTLEEFKTSLKNTNIDYDKVFKFYKENIIAYKLINKTIISNIKVSDDEIEEYYESTKEKYVVPNQVQIRHLLILFGNETENQTYNKAKEVEEQIDDNHENFCELVKEHTQDVASADTCGEYNFSAQDPLVPEFIQAGFDMKKDEIRIVKTQFGYHIMLKVSDIPSKTASLEEVKSQITTFLTNKKTIDEYEELRTNLREKAIIEVYKEEGTTTEKEEAKQTVITETPIKETLNTKEAEKQSLTQCLIEKDAKMYTVYWSPDNELQLSIFSDSKEFTNVVECDPEGQNSKANECEQLEIKVYPTWVINNTLLEGVQSIRGLKEASGC